MNRFIQIHMLTSYPAALLNRDDAGFAKRIPFGGATRTRISSQCLKRHWRTHDGAASISQLGEGLAVRSRRTFEQRVLLPLQESGIAPDIASAVTESLMVEVFGESAKVRKAKADTAGKGKKGKTDEATDTAPAEDSVGFTKQVTVLGPGELRYLLEIARAVCAQTDQPSKVGDAVKTFLKKEGRKNLEAMSKAAGVDAAMFGRMVTGDILARGDAAVHVAHAFTVHEEESESDYFSAIDDIERQLFTRGEGGSQLGSGHISSTELTSGLFYSYVAIDVPLLICNLEGCKREHVASADRALAAELAQRFVQLVATVSPGAKLGSTAPHSYASFMLVESGNEQPRTLANAFLTPVRAGHSGLLASTSLAIADHLKELNDIYGLPAERSVMGVSAFEPVAQTLQTTRTSLAETAAWVRSRIMEA